MSKIIKNLK